MLFKEIKLIEPIQKALEKNNYVTATPIQEKSIPHILEGKDLIGIAQTGTGKTAAFSLPLLQNMYNQSKKVTFTSPKALILAPTRELAAQIGENIAHYSTFTNFKQTVIFGGVKQDPQVRALNKGVDIIIATPGRLLDLLNQKLVDLSHIEYLILDEADRMLDMGFIHDIKKVLAKLPKQRQSLFFSATMPESIVELTKKFLNNPTTVQVKPQSTTIEKINQDIYFVDTPNKNQLLLDLLNKEDVGSSIVFTRTKHKSNQVAKFLSANNIPAEAIHGNKSQNARTKTMSNFKTGKIKVLLATEIAARGIDIDNITHVINYELPNEPESYVHRIGRTARAGTEGTAHSFCSADERKYLSEIEEIIKMKIPVTDNHKFHSNSAQNAKGADAKPKKKQNQRNNNSNNNNSQKNNKPTKSDREREYNKPKKEYSPQKGKGKLKLNQKSRDNEFKFKSKEDFKNKAPETKKDIKKKQYGNNNENSNDKNKENNHKTRNHSSKPYKKKNTNFKPKR
jgi:ATP-dependent RNA helicase RhlE